MAEETLRDVRAGPACLTLQGVSEIQASLTDEGKVRSRKSRTRTQLGRSANSEGLSYQILLNLPPPEGVQPVIDTGGLIPAIISLFDSDDTSLQDEAAWIVTNLASGTNQQTEQAIDAGVIPRLIILSASPNADVAVWALGNILADSAELRDRVEEKGGVTALVKLVDCGKGGFEKVKRTAVWAIFCYLNSEVYSELPITRVKHVLLCLTRYIRETPIN
ncbi:hypothetical protein M407DRAFT_34653 [Tulasnella calospora MUT 4182]|uniref:IBB domain-containing protein n=1 Tax=Tulasnella calospora MUT 4182 TaxID=1051891 RepID=A0A0C3Q0A4_9AGAM|nr:hypothetical protein M407DRAFT_34653 [Tulasnella calospora MUT 4182]